MNRAWLPHAQPAAFDASGTDAHRLFSDADGWVERLGQDALISFKTPEARDAMLEGLTAWSESSGWNARRVFAKLLPRQNEDRDPPVLLAGDPALPLATEIRENGVRYGLDFSAGYSAGLFLDQRANRAFVRKTPPGRLLNTFAYTCSFSVVAALAGGETMSIDLSRKSLDRGRANFVLNGLDPAASHRFLADDVLEVLPRLARRGEKFDAIILDPPTFSRGNKGRRWQVEQHFEELVLAAMELATPSARILMSTNCTKVQIADMERIGRFALKFHRRAGDFHREPAMPDFPAGQGARTLWMLLRG
jgi:23S rRNA (cytosine1962-C5)-methyltransferase